MRELKFRAWEKDKMIQWEDFDRLLKNPSVIPTKLFEGNDIIKVMQFTGLTDKNGVDDYESDIIRVKDATDNSGYSNHELLFDWRGAGIIKDGIHIRLDMLSEHEIIGNIHQDKNLLK